MLSVSTEALKMQRAGRSVSLALCMSLTVLALVGWHTVHSEPLQLMLDADDTSHTFQLDTRNILGLSVAFLVASMAASAGVGGGAFFVPLAMVCLNFSLKEATVLSQSSIAAVSAASIIFNLPKRHPLHPATKTLIDYEMLLTFTPPLLLGVSVGVVFNAAFPTWLITTMLITMLGYMSVKTTQKGLQQWRNESKRRKQEAAAAEAATISAAVPPDAATPAAGQLTPPASGNTAAAVVVITDDAPGGSKPVAAAYPWAMLCGVVFLWCGFSALQLLRQQTERCSTAYFAVCGAQVLFGAGCSVLFAYFCIAKPARQRAAAAEPGGLQQPLLAGSSAVQQLEQREQQQQSMTRLMITAAEVAVAGVVAGILGIGGGMIMAPMLLASGVHPLSGSATSNILVFMCSSSATLAFLLDGRVNVQYSEVYCAVCGVASLIGLTVMGRLVAKSGRPSIVVLLLAFIMGSGALCSGVFGYIDAWEQAQHGAGGFKSICSQ